MDNMMPEEYKLTAQQALELNRADAIERMKQVYEVISHVNLDELMEKLFVESRKRDLYMVSKCEVVEPGYEKYPCVEDYGHEGGHTSYEFDDDRRPDGSHPWDH